MGVLNENPSLAAIVDDLDRRLKALEQSKRFVVPYTATNPANPQNGEAWFNSATKDLRLQDGATLQTLVPGAWTTFTASWFAGVTPVPTSTNLCAYARIGSNTVVCRIQIFASGSVGAGTWIVALPVGTANYDNHGTGWAYSTPTNAPVMVNANGSYMEFYLTTTGTRVNAAIASGSYVTATVVYQIP